MILRTTNSPTQERIIDQISYSFRIPSSRIYPYTHLQDDLLLDQIDIMLLIASLEAKFNIILSNEEVASIQTVEDASFYFGRKFAA